MALADSTKVDFLWKKLGFGVAKTAPPSNKEAFNESIPSPLLMRGDKVWQQSGTIPSVKPNSSTSVVEIYQDAAGGQSTVETTEDLTAPDNQTWKTGLTDWIPTEFGSTYLVKVYVDTAGAANPQSTGTQLFQSGSGNEDGWFFDYQAGVLNFNGENIPSQIDTGVTGKSIYIVGARYVGLFGVGSGSSIGNLTVADTTLATLNAGDNIILEVTGNGTVQIDTTTALGIAVGNTAQRPGSPDTGDLRFNTTTGFVEIYNGAVWNNVGASELGTITSQILNGDSSTTVFTLNASSSTAGVIISINGTIQEPTVAYSVSGTTLTFTEAPATGDTIEVRFISAVTTVSSITNISGTNRIEVLTNGVADISTVQSLQLPTYTVATAANIANVANGQIIYVTDGDGGSPSLAVYSVDNWKKVLLSGNISSV